MSAVPHFLSGVDWAECPKQEYAGMPYATHSGVLEILGFKLRCHRLNTGEAVIDADDLEALMSVMGES